MTDSESPLEEVVRRLHELADNFGAGDVDYPAELRRLAELARDADQRIRARSY
jgi:hypothetical protein